MIHEKQKILNNTFDCLWNEMWLDTHKTNINNNHHYKNEINTSFKKFDLLKKGIVNDGYLIKLNDIINNSTSNWDETEWEFPKGRRNFKEKDLECALREFEEETGISKSKIVIVENILPFEEIFIGTNHKSYKHKYFLAFTNEIDDCLNNFQVTEVSKLEWKTIDECLEAIRPYNLEKKTLISNINKVLQEYRLYS